MEIIMGKKSSQSDKMDGEFRVPLSFGKGNNKTQCFACIHCGEPTCLKSNTQSFICHKCGNYNSDREACIKKYEDYIQEYSGKDAAHVMTDQAKEMIAMRDTMQVKADLYAAGVTRERLGGDKYRSVLNNKLKEFHIGKSRYRL